MVNPYRNCEELYDVLSAYQLIRSVGAEVGKYDFSEEILESDFVFSQKGKTNLVHTFSCTGLLKVFPEVKEKETAFEGVCRWIWQCLVSSGVKNYMLQSLSIMSENERYQSYFL